MGNRRALTLSDTNIEEASMTLAVMTKIGFALRMGPTMSGWQF
jgi:hypothetical protein